MNIRAFIAIFTLALTALCTAQAAAAAPVSRFEVRIVTGSRELGAGSELELRIYATGSAVKRFPLAHGEAWLPNSTHLIPVLVAGGLDPRTVTRFSLFYRAGSALAAPLDIVAADVEMPAADGAPQRLLDATLSGVLVRQGELATVDRDASQLVCMTDHDCDDGRTCNGHERCAPHAGGADARGCLKGTPVVCPVNQVCGEGVGCRGLAAPKAAAPPAQ
jgi:hypothetical protein